MGGGGGGEGVYWIWVVRHNFVSTQYFENKLLEFHQILYMHSYMDKIFVGLVTHNSSHNCTRVMALYLRQNFVYAQYLENKQISPNFIYAIISTRSMLGLLHIIFRTIVPELWPVIYAKISKISIS